MATPRKPRGTRKTEDFGSKVKAHQRYYTTEGEQVPGATTVLGVLKKGNLTAWANKLGLDGIDANKFRDEAASIGSLSHYLIECELHGVEPDLADYTPAQVERASHALTSFHNWRTDHVLEPVLIEGQLVSDTWLFGGTIDFYGLVDGRRTLLDFKTSKAVYNEHKYQVASYAKLLMEHGYGVQQVRVIKVGRTEGENFEEHVLSKSELVTGWAIFRHALRIYWLQKQMKGSR